MTHQSLLSQTVQRRIHIIRIVRPILSVQVASALLFVVAVMGVGREVWMEQVLLNMPPIQDIPATARFFFYAFTHTELAVQGLLVVAASTLVWFAHACARIPTRMRQFA